jgi:hypothetical protein
LKKVSFPRPKPHFLLQKHLFPSDCGRNQMESQKGLERVGVRGREEPFLKRFSLPRDCMDRHQLGGMIFSKVLRKEERCRQVASDPKYKFLYD